MMRKYAIPFALALAVLLPGCVKEDMDMSCAGVGKTPIEFRSAKDVQSRGEAVPGTTLPVGSKVSLWGLWYPYGSSDNGLIPDGTGLASSPYGWGSPVVATVEAQGIFSYTGTKYWPETEGDKMLFLSLWPEVSSVPGLTVTLDDTYHFDTEKGELNTEYMELDYTLPTDVAQHIDLMYAVTERLNPQTVDLQYHHLLTKVDFSARKGDGFDQDDNVVITDITVQDALVGSKLRLYTNNSIDTVYWAGRQAADDPDVYFGDVTMSSEANEDNPVLTGEALTNVYTTQMNYIDGTSGPRHSAIMMPMDGLEASYFHNIVVEVSVLLNEGEDDEQIRTYNMPMREFIDVWTIGKQVTYLMTIDDDALEIEGSYIIEDWVDADIDAVIDTRLDVSTTEVTINDINRARVYFWTNNPDVSVLEEGFVDGLTGEQEIRVSDYLYDLSSEYSDNFYYDPSTGEGWIDIATDRILEAIADDGNVDEKIAIWLQAGTLRKRIEVTINIDYPALPDMTTTPYIGAFWRHDQTGERIIAMNVGSYAGWTVEIEYPDGGPTGWVKLSSKKSLDADLWTDIPGNPENYQLEEEATDDILESYYNGSMVYFRVGTTGTIGEEEVRYAKLKLTVMVGLYGHYDYELWLRQGDAADYLMQPDSERPYSARFSPYNLTAAAMTEDRQYVPLALNGGAFTEYPTQAGAFFQFMSSLNPLYAYHPTNPPSIAWDNSATLLVWDSSNETCPPGYRRPQTADTGSTDGETYQSLIHISRNYVVGLYADGFFDRRVLDTKSELNSNSTIPMAVAVNTKDVAYVGRLFYNPSNHASLFFPSSGCLRTDGTLRIANTGGVGTYFLTNGWLATGINLVTLPNAYYSQYPNNNDAYSIRCVVDE